MSRYIPKDSVEITRPGVEAVVYASGAIYALGYAGKAQNPTFNYHFPNAAQRDAYVEQFFAGLEQTAKAKAERAAARKAWRHGFQVGDILSHSWGWEQTNVNFYQVIAVNGARITLRDIAHRGVAGTQGFMSEAVVPLPDHFLADAEPFVKRPACYGDQTLDASHVKGHVRMEHGSCTEWDGDPEYTSWYA